MEKLLLKDCSPHIRYVNNYRPAYSYTETERKLFDHEFMYVMAGEVEMHYDNRVYILKKGDLFYLKPAVPNYIVVEESRHFRTHCIHFDWMTPAPEYDFTAEEFYMHSVLGPDYDTRLATLRERPQAAPSDFPLPCHVTSVPYESLASLFSKCFLAFTEKSPAAQIRLKAAFWEILALLAADVLTPQGTAFAHPQIMHAMEYLRSNYTRNISVPDLAGKYKLSPKYFGTLFKAAVGKSVSEFVLELRIYAAKEMLLGSDLTIEEIAERIGFQNPFYFSKCFKLQEKLSPSQYRSMMRV